MLIDGKILLDAEEPTMPVEGFEEKNRFLAIGLVLLFVLPPIGMGWLVAGALGEWFRVLKSKKGILIDDISLLLLVMMAASVGSALSHLHADYLLYTFMLFAYLGIYLSVRNHPGRLRIGFFTRLMIFGGLYLYISEKLYSLFTFDSPTGRVIAFLTGHYLFGTMGSGRLLGSAYNANYACYLLILAVAALFAELLRFVRFRNRVGCWLMFASLLVLDVAIYQTGSRAGFVITLMLHLLFLFLWKRKWFFAALWFTVLAAPLLMRLMPRVDSTALSMAKRLVIWKNSLKLIAENPLYGVTPIGFPADYREMTGEMIPHAHDLFLATFSISGIFCGLLMLAVIIASSYGLLRTVKFERHKYTTHVFLFALPTIVGYGLFDFTLSSPQVLIIVLSLLAFWMRHLRTSESTGEVVHLLATLFHRQGLSVWKKKTPRDNP
jgi:hypothetical protein